MDNNDELMVEVLQEDEEAAAHLQRWNMGFTFLLQLSQQMDNAVPRQGGSALGRCRTRITARTPAPCCCAPTILQTMQ
jgi:hypothetical protein